MLKLCDDVPTKTLQTPSAQIIPSVSEAKVIQRVFLVPQTSP